MGLGTQSWRLGFSAHLIEICLGIQSFKILAYISLKIGSFEFGHDL